MFGRLTIIAILCATHFLPAFAHEPITKFDNMAVIATKTEKKVFDVAGSTSHINQDDLYNIQAERLSDLFKITPSVEISGGPRKTAEQVNIRGFGQNRTVLRVDGARQNFNFGHNAGIFMDPEFLSEVDVLRGPQSSLYGSGAIGGIVGFRTLEAKDLLRKGEDWGAKAKIGYGSNQKEFLANTSLYGRYEDRIDGLTSFVFRDSDDLKTGKNKKVRYSADEIKSGLFKANAYILDSHKITGSFLVFKDNLSTLSTPNLLNSDQINLRMSNLNMFLGPDLNFPVLRDTRQLTSTLGYVYQNDENPWLNLNAKIYNTDTNIKDKINNDIVPRLKRIDRTKFSTNGLDVYNTTNLKANDDFGLKITYGVEHFKDDQKGFRNGLTRAQFPKAHATNTGLYIREEMTFFKKLNIATGYRHDTFNAYPAKELKLPKRHDHHGSTSFSATLRPIDCLMTYISYAEAFRAPHLTELYGGGIHFMTRFPNFFIPNPDLSPERAKTTEFGLGLTFDNIFIEQDKFRTKWAYFVTHTNDFIERKVRVDMRVMRNNYTIIENITSARIRGFEGEGAYESTYLFGGFGFSALNGYDKTHSSRIASVPPMKFAFTLGSNLPEIDAKLGCRSIFNREQKRARHQTAQTPPQKTHGFATHDVFMSYLPQQNWAKGIEFNIGVDNLFNKYYRKHLANIPEMGRNFKLSLGFKL